MTTVAPADSAAKRAAFVQAAAEETGLKPELLKREVGRVLLKLEELQEERLRAQVAPEPMAYLPRKLLIATLKPYPLYIFSKNGLSAAILS